MAYTTPVWWGQTDFGLDQSLGWNLAGLELLVTRAAREWRFQTWRPAEQQEDQQSWSSLTDNLPEDAPVARYFFQETTPTLHLLPRLADRSVVVKPVNPIFIASGQEITLYVSTPVWVSCYAEGRDSPLIDLAIIRPTDTWFGRSTIHGEVCYATRVLGRTNLDHFPVRPFRAITPINVCNSGSSLLPIERINIPVPYLPVYAAESGRLWTPPLHVLKEPGLQPPRIRIETAISAVAGRVELLTPPRTGGGDHALFRIFDNFF